MVILHCRFTNRNNHLKTSNDETHPCSPKFMPSSYIQVTWMQENKALLYSYIASPCSFAYLEKSVSPVLQMFKKKNAFAD